MTVSQPAAASTARRLIARRSWLSILMALLLLLTPGCGGCRSGGAAKQQGAGQEKEAEKKQVKPNFELSKLRVEPADPEVIPNYVKPGHWISTQQLIRANNFDFSAELHAQSTDNSQRPILIEGTRSALKLSRPAGFAKGQAKYVESVFPIPASSREGRQVWLRNEVWQRRGRQQVAGGSNPTARMMSYEFMFVVLTSAPDEYKYVKLIDSVDPPLNDPAINREAQYYKVMLPRIDQRVPVPSHPLTWTAIAYVIWDEVDPDLMTPPQQQAMLDWLHWGGQLIINGPDNLDVLKSSFLGPYLPADDGGARRLTQDDFADLNARWSRRSEKRRQRLTMNVLDSEELAGVSLALRPDGSFLADTGQLVAERRVGAGRIVTTAFSLTSRQFKAWGCMDNFFNSCLLRRPGRDFFTDAAATVSVRWTRLTKNSFDPRLLSGVRYFTRDIPSGDDSQLSQTIPSDDWHYQGYATWNGAGVAGWNDRSGASMEARAALRRAAGISVPNASFVLKSVAVYLLVLVPLNWAFFRMIGRVEWAWVAAPVIAVAGSIFVSQAAELDIGFARSLTEAAVLELQGSYPRGHLTRYSALYTSLSTRFDMEMEDLSSIAQPFSANLNYQLRLHDTIEEVSLRRDRQVTLSGFRVNSNTTGMVHSEQMYDVGGPLELTGDEQRGLSLSNGSRLPLNDSIVVRRNKIGGLEYAYLAELAPATERPLQFKTIADLAAELPEWQNSEAFSTTNFVEGSINFAGIAKRALDHLRVRNGDYRLLAWTDQPLEGIRTKPEPSQITQRTMVLAHLQRAALPAPEADSSLRIDFAEDEQRVLEMLEEAADADAIP